MKLENIEVYTDALGLAQAAAQHFVDQAHKNISTHGQFNVALSGGTTPRVMHSILAAAFRDEVDWSKVYFFWGDERNVPPDHPDSNYRIAYETLIDPLGIGPTQIHRIQAELPPEEAAHKYQQALRQHLDSKSPQFDLILLGMGADGHTASLFPDTNALDENESWVVANWVEKMDSWRITLTAPFINSARQITLLIAGESKASALKKVLEGPRETTTYPSQLIQPNNGSLLWLLDQAAASQLTSTE